MSDNSKQARCKDVTWNLNMDANGRVSTADAQLAVLMDIRDALHDVSQKLDGWGWIGDKLRKIEQNTSKRKYIKK
jgi:predicted component of type VI protein secretion system